MNRHSTTPFRGRPLAIGTSLTLAALILSGCGAAGADPAPTTADQPVAGGDLVIGVYTDPTCVDPHQIGSNVSLSMSRQIADSLTEQDPETGEIVPWLAESWEVNEDGSAFTFTLRDDVTFSDGSEFTAQVVKDNIDGIVAMGAKAPVSGPYLAGLQSASVIDDLTIEISFAKPNAQFLQATSNIAMAMVSSETAKMTAEQRCADGVIGAGPFILDSYAANDATVLTKREGYAWQPPSAKHEGEAYLDSITFRVLPENSVRTGALLSGQIDAMDNVQQQDEASVSGNGFSIVTRANPGFAVSVQFRMDSEIAGDLAVRQAMMLAVDRADVLTVLGPTGAETLGLLTETTPGAADFTQFLEYDPDRAAEILDEAGWVAGSDGIREKDGTRLELEFPYFFDGAVVELLQQQYAEIGIRLNTSEVAVADLLVAFDSGSWDATVGNLTRADIDVLRSLLTNTGANYNHLADAELQTLLEAQAAEPDADARSAIADEVQELVLDQAYVVPLHALAAAYAVQDGVHDLQLEASTRLWLYDTWMTP